MNQMIRHELIVERQSTDLKAVPSLVGTAFLLHEKPQLSMTCE